MDTEAVGGWVADRLWLAAVRERRRRAADLLQRFGERARPDYDQAADLERRVLETLGLT